VRAMIMTVVRFTMEISPYTQYIEQHKNQLINNFQTPEHCRTPQIIYLKTNRWHNNHSALIKINVDLFNLRYTPNVRRYISVNRRGKRESFNTFHLFWPYICPNPIHISIKLVLLLFHS